LLSYPDLFSRPSNVCSDAKKTLPKPKIGDYCTIAMEQGYSDACFALCMYETPVNRVAQACRAASMEMPRPTVRRWCEHGYNVAYKKTIVDLADTFGTQEPITEAAPAAEEPKAAPAAVINTIPISLDDQMHNLLVHEGESVEDALAAFCHKHAADDTAGCIRHLLPIVLETLEESA
jgi:hypothetical protein